MDSKLNLILLNEIQNKCADTFSLSEFAKLIRIFSYQNNLSNLPLLEEYPKKSYIKNNMNLMDDKLIIAFLTEIKDTDKVKQNKSLSEQIDTLIEESKVGNSRIKILRMLKDYPEKIGQQWINCCLYYNEDNYRDSLDAARLSIELLVKNILGNRKSLENQTDELGTWLKSKGSDASFRNLLTRCLDMYTKIQNDNAKHDVPEKLNKAEISFLMNLSHAILKLLIDFDKKQGIDHER